MTAPSSTLLFLALLFSTIVSIVLSINLIQNYGVIKGTAMKYW
jgi:hypothetical protein